MFSIQDIRTLKQADVDSSDSVRGLIRVGRRVAKRCWWDQATIKQHRVFCQNGGACGSTYIVHLLNENGVDRSYHELKPDLLQLGLDHYERPLASSRLVRLLRYTRYYTYFEANNRLFSMTKELAIAFPLATFIHLHRDGTECVRSAMSKQNVDEYIRTNARFKGMLAGPHGTDTFTRFCYHWANVNHRIYNDIQQVRSKKSSIPQKDINLRFEDLVKGKLQPLEDAIGRSLDRKTSQPINVRPVRNEGKFPKYNDWTQSQKQTFADVCGEVMDLIGR